MAKGIVYYKTDEEIELMRESNLLVGKTLGLVASMVLRCDDCIKYHLETSFANDLYKNGVTILIDELK